MHGALHANPTAVRPWVSHLQYMSFFDPPPCATMASWINFLHSESVAFAATTWAQCRVPSLVTLTVNGTRGVDPAAQFGQGASLICSEPCPHCGHDSYFLCDGWQSRLVNLGTLLRPHIASGAVAGIFVGDELLHMNLGYDNLVNLSQALRAQFPEPAILYGNFEGSWITNDKLFPRVPESWDLVSADEYWNVNHTDDHTAGWPLAGKMQLKNAKWERGKEEATRANSFATHALNHCSSTQINASKNALLTLNQAQDRGPQVHLLLS